MLIMLIMLKYVLIITSIQINFKRNYKAFLTDNDFPSFLIYLLIYLFIYLFYVFIYLFIFNSFLINTLHEKNPFQ